MEEGTIKGCALISAMYNVGIKTSAKEMEPTGIVQIGLGVDLLVVGEPEDPRKWF